MTAFTQDHTTVNQGVCCGDGIGTTTFRQKYLGLYPPPAQTQEITSPCQKLLQISLKQVKDVKILFRERGCISKHTSLKARQRIYLNQAE